MTRAMRRGADRRCMPAEPDLIDVIIEDERWRDALGAPGELANACRAASGRNADRVDGDVALLLTSDAALRDLNRRFRGLDKPTNVLSFPAGEAAKGFLGDIAIAFETTAREATDLSISFRDHAAHLIVHGLLHLAGYDHEDDREAEEMESLERKILADLGVADPYRSGGESA